MAIQETERSSSTKNPAMSDAANAPRSPQAGKTPTNDSRPIASASSSSSSTENVNINTVKDAGIKSDAEIDKLSKQVQDVELGQKEETKDATKKTDDVNHQTSGSVGSAPTEYSTSVYASSTKIKSPDTKSMVSSTTCTMDEKESLRPDDSASVKATEDDDNASTSLSAKPHGDAFGSQQNSSGGASFSPHGYPLEPDEKLIDAMNSPKDRVLVLQLEKRIIDFIRSSNEQSLELPPSNAFGRLLAHKLGDYYHLTHFVDNNVTSVRLHRTPYCRLPTPLSVLCANNTKTPPPNNPPMKIMRRAPLASSAPGSGAASSAPSKATSETGGDDAGSSTGAMSSRDRAAMSREEREAKYQAARERIFRDFPETRSPNTNDQGNDNSQSNSGGRRKETKQKIPHDDSFDARSEYNVYYPGIHFPPGQQPFNGAVPGVPFASPSQYAPVPHPSSQPVAYPVAAQQTAVYQGFGGMNPPVPQNPFDYGVNPNQQQQQQQQQQVHHNHQQPWQSRSHVQSSTPTYPLGPPHNQGQTFNQPIGAARPSPGMPYAMPQPNAYMRAQQFCPLPQHTPNYQQAPPQTQRSIQPLNWSQPYHPIGFPNQLAYDQSVHNSPSNTSMPMGGYRKPPVPMGHARPAPFNPHTRSFVPGNQSPSARYSGNYVGQQFDAYNQPSYLAHPWQDFDGANVRGMDDPRRVPMNAYNVPPKNDKTSIAKWGTPAHLPPKPPPSESAMGFHGRMTHPGLPPQAERMQQPPFSYPSAASMQENGPLLVVGSIGASKPRDT